MGIAPLPEEPFGPENSDDTGYTPLVQKKPRESEGYEAYEEELEGDEGPYGSLVMFRPKTFKKKPVLALDPEELEKAYQAFELCGAQIMEGGETPAPRPGSNFLGLAPIEEGEEAIESDDDVVADDDLDALLENALHATEEDWDQPARTVDDLPQAAEEPPVARAEPGPTVAHEPEQTPETPEAPVETRVETWAALEPEPEPAPEAEPEQAFATDPIPQPEPEPESEPARPSFSLPAFEHEAQEEEEDDALRGDGWSLVPPEDEPAVADELEEPVEAYAEPSGYSEPEDSGYGTTTYFDDEEDEDVFDPFAVAEAPRLAQVQEAGTRSQLRARLLRQEEQEAEAAAAKSGFSLFGWLRRVFG